MNLLWSSVVFFLASAISDYTPPACWSAQAADMAVSVAISEAYSQSDLVHEAIFGEVIEHGCNFSPGWYSGLATALRLRGSSACDTNHHCRAYFRRESFAADRVARLYSLWASSSRFQHYAIHHFTADWYVMPASWCARGQIVIDQTRFC